MCHVPGNVVKRRRFPFGPLNFVVEVGFSLPWSDLDVLDPLVRFLNVVMSEPKLRIAPHTEPNEFLHVESCPKYYDRRKYLHGSL